MSRGVVLACGHWDEALVWIGDAFQCQDCLLGRPVPEGTPPRGVRWNAAPTPAADAPRELDETETDETGLDGDLPDPEPAKPKSGVTLAPKAREYVAKVDPPKPKPAPAARRSWLFPDKTAVAYEYLDARCNEWHVAEGSAAKVYAEAAVLLAEERVLRGMLTAWGRPIGPAWYPPFPIALRARDPLDLLRELAAGRAILVEI